MPISDIILSVGEVLVTETSSPLGIVALDAAKTRFGTVASVYSTSDNTVVGDQVIFNPQGAVQIQYGSTIYYKIKENNISGTESVAP